MLYDTTVYNVENSMGHGLANIFCVLDLYVLTLGPHNKMNQILIQMSARFGLTMYRCMCHAVYICTMPHYKSSWFCWVEVCWAPD